MICSNCGTQNPDGNKFCSKCGATLEQTVIYSTPATIPAMQPSKANPFIAKTPYLIGAVFTFIFAIICFVKGSYLSSIESIAGDTIAEAYYQGMGGFVSAFGWLGLAAIALMIGMIIKKR